MPEPAKPDAKRAALQAAISQIEKQFGRGSIMRLGAEPKLVVNGISTGSLALDLALGGGGIPRARVSEIFGPEASGKTTVCLHLAANAQLACRSRRMPLLVQGTVQRGQIALEQRRADLSQRHQRRGQHCLLLLHVGEASQRQRRQVSA